MKLYLSWEFFFLVRSDLHLRNNQQQQYKPSLVKMAKIFIPECILDVHHSKFLQPWKNFYFRRSREKFPLENSLLWCIWEEFSSLVFWDWIFIHGRKLINIHLCHDLKNRPLWRLKWSPWLHISSLNYHCVVWRVLINGRKIRKNGRQFPASFGKIFFQNRK